MSETDKQYDGRLIDNYAMLKRIKKAAEKEGATETIEIINQELDLIKLKLQPTELPD